MYLVILKLYLAASPVPEMCVATGGLKVSAVCAIKIRAKYIYELFDGIMGECTTSIGTVESLAF